MEVNPTSVHPFWLPRVKYEIIKQIFNLPSHVIVLSKHQTYLHFRTFTITKQKFESDVFSDLVKTWNHFYQEETFLSFSIKYYCLWTT
jgi:hypothetical protein